MDGAAGTAHVAVIANAIKASGVVIRVEAADFLRVLKQAAEDAPLVVVARGGVFKKHHAYLTSYKGLAFYTTSENPLVLPPRVETILAKKISIPEL